MTFISLVASTAALAAETEQFDPNKVSPGVGGFVVIACLAIALFFLGFDLVRRLRRAKYRAEIQAELAPEIAAMQAAGAADDADPLTDSQITDSQK